MGDEEYKYQYGFSEEHPDEMYDFEKRTRKGNKTMAVLLDYLSGKGKDPTELRLLDIGCSTGFMTRLYGRYFGEVVGIDIDEGAVRYAKENNSGENIGYFVSDSMDTGFDNESFDVISCTHIYEHVPDSKRLVSEIYRLLKKGGACYFAAGNRLVPIEGHYRLPLLSVIPKPLAHLYLRILGRGTYYYESHLTYLGLKRLVSPFEICDYTLKVIEDPERYHAADMVRPGSIKQKIALTFLKVAYFISPTYIWVLKKGDG
ncbi:MAG: class I SAM-dependent methyltransferase [Deltaproteobacteria bacterium]|uniref:Class I SAM-dependent methyltransferase n=1 Tax=Candidatus Zymogenus saltonus TaxID=2844893 RepID=A0A9D8KDW5_9DELT|nr:class I SAM-dependent methyltransferase [Candidatus Zymogenus saltonus]